jgi:hypothetical protein
MTWFSCQVFLYFYCIFHTMLDADEISTCQVSSRISYTCHVLWHLRTLLVPLLDQKGLSVAIIIKLSLHHGFLNFTLQLGFNINFKGSFCSSYKLIHGKLWMFCQNVVNQIKVLYWQRLGVRYDPPCYIFTHCFYA